MLNKIFLFLVLVCFTANAQLITLSGNYTSGGNIVQNPSFEIYTDGSPNDAFTGWTFTGSVPTLQASVDSVTDGTVCARFVAGSSGSAYITQNITVEPNTLYYASVDAVVSASTGGFRIYDNTNSADIYYLWNMLNNTSAMKTHSVVFKTASNTTSIYIRVGIVAPATTTQYYDNVKLQKLTQATVSNKKSGWLGF